MTATPFDAVRGVARPRQLPTDRRKRRPRAAPRRAFRRHFAEPQSSRPTKRRPAASPRGIPADLPIRPRHVIAAEAILARLREGVATGTTSRDLVPRPATGPVHAFRSAKRIVLSGLDRVDHRLQRTLRRRGFDRAEVADLAEAVMSGMIHRAEMALNHLPLAPRPFEAAKGLFGNVLDRIADDLAGALRRQGLGRERIAEICHAAMAGVDDWVEASLDGLAERWAAGRGAAGAR